jgi:hypothetical protein
MIFVCLLYSVNCPTVICLPSMLFILWRDTSSELWISVHSFTLLLLFTIYSLTRVNSTNVLDEGIRIGGIGRQMNSKVNQSNKVYLESKLDGELGLLSIWPSSSSPGPHRPLLAPIYRWPGLKKREGYDTYYNIGIRHELVFRLGLHLGLT